MIRVSIVEDQAEYVELLKRQMAKTDDIVCISDYDMAEDALGGLVKDRPDIVLMDIDLKGTMNGIECMFRVKDKCKEMLFIMYTVFDNDQHLFNALESGADGYVLKREKAKDVLEAIRELNDGGAPMSRVIASKVIRFFHEKNKARQLVEKLTTRQNEILKWLAQGLLYKEVADKLSPPVTEGTVKQHISRIYKKLQVNNRTEAINKWQGRSRPDV